MNRARPDMRGSRSTTTGVRIAISIGIMLLVALVHVFRIGTYLQGSLFTLYYSYCSDILVPFAMYFVLCMNDAHLPILRSWRTKALLVFGAASATEVMQAFGVPLLGSTFDPLDFVMFGGGVLLAAFLDRVIFGRFVPHWSLVTKVPADATRKNVP